MDEDGREEEEEEEEKKDFNFPLGQHHCESDSKQLFHLNI